MHPLRTALTLALLSLPLAAAPAHAGDCPMAKAQAQTQAHATAPTNVVELATTVPELSTLVAAIQAAQLVDPLADAEALTVFAPTNEAFAKLPKATLEALLRPENRHELQRVLSYHVLPSKVSAKAARTQSAAATLAGPRVRIADGREGLTIDGARVLSADVDGVNAVVHVIDRVLLPPDLDLVETAKAGEDFGTLLAAAEAAGFLEELAGHGPFTIFAPTDAAFARLPEGSVAALLEPGAREQLRAVLRNHIVRGRVYADEAVAAGALTNTAHERLRVSFAEGQLKVNGVRVASADLQARNGVIHVIDRVLVP